MVGETYTFHQGKLQIIFVNFQDSLLPRQDNHVLHRKQSGVSQDTIQYTNAVSQQYCIGVKT
jgi:hypothetical protein